MSDNRFPCIRTDDHEAHSAWKGLTLHSCLGVPQRTRIDEIADTMITRPDAVHAVQDGALVCLGTVICDCHWYPNVEGGPAVQHEQCRVADLTNAMGLGVTFEMGDDRLIDSWPDGEVELRRDSDDRPSWRYVDGALNQPAVNQ